jgi:hypothetical protein
MRQPFARAAAITAAYWRIKSLEENTEAKGFVNSLQRRIPHPTCPIVSCDYPVRPPAWPSRFFGRPRSSGKRPRSSRRSGVGRSRGTVSPSGVRSSTRSNSTRSSSHSRELDYPPPAAVAPGCDRPPRMSPTPHISSQRTQPRTSTPRVLRPAASSRTKCSSCTRNSVGRIARSSVAKSSFQRQHPCPSTDRTSDACPGFVVDQWWR